MSSIPSPMRLPLSAAIRGVYHKAGGVYGRVDAAPALPLDALTAGAAYSVRRLRTAYTGPLMRVRRSSDNTEQDIGYRGDNWLDETALLTFVGAGSGFVVTWYDQSGNARNVSQATTANQPRIVNSGAVDKFDGVPELEFDGSNDLLSNTSPFLWNAGASTSFMVMTGAPQIDKWFFSEGWSGSNTPVFAFTTTSANGANVSVIARNDANTLMVGRATPLISGIVNSGLFRIAIKDTGTQISGYGNGTIGATTSYTRSGTTTQDRFAVGALLRGNAQFFWLGSVLEAIFFPSALSDTDFAVIDSSEESAFPFP